MKLTKLFSIALFGALAATQVNAAPETESRPMQQQQDVPIKNYNSSVSIQLAGFDAQEVEGKKYLIFVHNVTNKGKNSTIKNIKWTTLLVNNEQIVLPIPAQVDNLELKPGTATQVAVTVPFEQLNEQVLAVITNPENRFQPIIAAQELGYTNGKRIVIK